MTKPTKVVVPVMNHQAFSLSKAPNRLEWKEVPQKLPNPIEYAMENFWYAEEELIAKMKKLGIHPDLAVDMNYTNTIALIQSEIKRLEYIIDNRINQNFQWSDDEKKRQISLIRSEIDELKKAQILLNSETTK